MTSEGAIESLMCSKQISNKKYILIKINVFLVSKYITVYIKRKPLTEWNVFIFFSNHISAETLLLGCVKLLLNNKKKYSYNKKANTQNEAYEA